MIRYQILEETPIEVIHQAFIDAFADYQIPMKPSLDDFIQMLIRRGYDAAFSHGAFDGDTLVGYVLNGNRALQGRPMVHDTGTGVLPAYRRQGIAKGLMEAVMSQFQSSNVYSYVLEVLQTNEGAINLYRSLGFQVNRSYDCLRYALKLNNDEVVVPMSGSDKQKHLVLYMDEMPSSIWDTCQTFWDFEPSWQNSIASILALPEQFLIGLVMYQGALAGYGIMDVQTGDIPQLAVHKAFRRNGIGSSILTGLIEQTSHGRASILNVDSGCESMIAFLKCHVFECITKQYEMVKPIQ